MKCITSEPVRKKQKQSTMLRKIFVNHDLLKDACAKPSENTHFKNFNRVSNRVFQQDRRIPVKFTAQYISKN